MCPTDIALLEPHLHRQFLGLRTQLETANVPIKAVYFFESGIGSVVAKLRTDVDTEVGMIGFEGMTGSALVMGDDRSAHDCYIQLDAEVFCIDVIPVRSMLSESPSLRTFLLRYAHYFHIQASFTGLINARLKLEERLARWLVMCGDRVDGEPLAITHEFLSVMLGVRRPGVTVALQTLEGRGLIRSNRGEIIIRDRAGLIKMANGSYGRPEAEYARLVGHIH
ncbi:Crp/Fnr family transcriptional regulator [Mesorhizobium sp. LMG17149]|uniref:Crp/Fnr family transcriptional regulator n=1 Tax=Mesorhizobium sp. LMG17149 TaxID=2968497 RepID=UPI00211913E5|nr:Crp/Fnr family transcriptional regulator [Mesorhizobium sp. LMG17149]MCQ8876249.1 Crp/Fnr family transcriptional regulator [Mesorhizobium sp. LMG17149]